MIGYGFGHDDEVPGGFQDADIEMRELEDAANRRKCARVFQEPTGKWHWSDDELDHLDARGTAYDTQISARRAAIANGYKIV